MKHLGKPITQRQLRVGEMIKQALGTLFIRDEAKIPNLSTKEIKMILDELIKNENKSIFLIICIVYLNIKNRKTIIYCRTPAI